MAYITLFLLTFPLVEGFLWNMFGSKNTNQASPPAVIGTFLVSPETQERIEETSEELKSLENSKGCWTKQRGYLLQRCGQPTHEARSDVANRLTNCQLDLNGLAELKCRSRDPSKCTSQLAEDIRSYNVYTNFFMHIENICHFMKSEEFRHSTLQTVQQLYDATLDTGKTLNEWSTKSEEMLSNLEDMHEKSHDRLNHIESSQINLLNQQQEMKEHTEEAVMKIAELKDLQMESFHEVLSMTGRLKEDLIFILEGLSFDLATIKAIDLEILRNIFHVHTLLFYSLSFFVFWFVTSNKRTHGCRYKLYSMLCVGVWLEMKFAELYLSIRALVFALNLVTLCVQCWAYRDLLVENNRMLWSLLKEKETSPLKRKYVCGIRLSMAGKIYGKRKSSKSAMYREY
jgi:hypothetical protein